MAKFYTPSKLSENIRETPEGFLLCIGVPIARTGWQEYGEGETPLEVGPDGTVQIYRSEEEVFRPETITSFEGKALCIKHPAEFVNPENWQYLAKGQLHNIRKAKEADEDGEMSLLADLLVNEARAIQLVKNGLREVSCGYEAEYEQTGEGKGIQTNIVGNHLALVEQGRAGSSYAINDEKRKGIMTKFEKALGALKKKFGAKVIDEAMAAAEDDGSETATVDKGMMDELVKTVKDLQVASQRIEGMVENKKAKDEEKAKDGPKELKEFYKKQKEDNGDAYDDDEGEGKIEERLTALEAAVAKLLEKKTGDEEESEESEKSEDDMDESEDDDDESEESEDADENEESEDAAEGEEGESSQKKSGKTGDAARIEILAPGFKPSKNSKTVKVDVLKKAYATKDGKQVIHSLTGGKAPDYKSEAQVGMLFTSVSEILKHKRGVGLDGTKDARSFETGDSQTEPMTAEKLNEANAKFYGEKKGS